LVIRTLSLRDKAEARIRAATYGAIKGADCEFSEGVLFLRGKVRNFYSKQLAQEAVGRLPGVVNIVNQIEVLSADQSS
jgi:osmotically-inducible protein OsmY